MLDSYPQHLEDGAFEIEVSGSSIIGKKLVDQEFLDKYVQEGAVQRHTMRGLIDSIRLVDATEFSCSEVSFLFMGKLCFCSMCENLIFGVELEVLISLSASVFVFI